MHASDDRTQLTDGSQLTELPNFDLRYLFDDGERPDSVTIYDPDTLETSWITIDADQTVGLEDLR